MYFLWGLKMGTLDGGHKVYVENVYVCFLPLTLDCKGG